MNNRELQRQPVDTGKVPERVPVTRLAGCIIRDAAGGILLLHKNTPKRVQWEIPGGKIDPGETPQVAAQRELLEELGVVVRVGNVLGMKEFDQSGKRRSYTWLEAQITEGIPTIKDTDEVDRFGYFSLGQLEEMRSELSGNTLNFLHELQQGRIRFSD